MLYIIAALLVALLLALRAWAPKRYAVHASQAKRLPHGVHPESRYMSAGFLRDQAGNRIDVSGKFVGQAIRESMASFGIPDGSTFIADYLDVDQQLRLKSGDIVVVDGEANYSETGLRLRRIDRIENGMAFFQPDGFGKGRRERPASEIIAKVTHLVNAESEHSGTLMRLIEKVLPWGHAEAA
jgi:hypothetical protein